MDEFAMDASVTYQDLEPMIEAEIGNPLPEGLVEPGWLELPELEQEWLDLPAIEQQWLDLPELDQEWLQAIEQGEPSIPLDLHDLEHDLDLEH